MTTDDVADDDDDRRRTTYDADDHAQLAALVYARALPRCSSNSLQYFFAVAAVATYDATAAVACARARLARIE